jgi:hypothetical protein
VESVFRSLRSLSVTVHGPYRALKRLFPFRHLRKLIRISFAESTMRDHSLQMPMFVGVHPAKLTIPPNTLYTSLSTLSASGYLVTMSLYSDCSEFYSRSQNYSYAGICALAIFVHIHFP